MIIVYVGGIGTGKSLSMVRHIITKPNHYTFANFKVKTKNYRRLQVRDIIKTVEEKGVNKRAKAKVKRSVNWDYWRKVKTKHKQFSIYVDESHNIISSRRSMSATNVIFNRWLSQIRKICGDSEKNHLILATQRFNKLDIDFRTLAQVIIECQKVTLKDGRIIIINNYYEGDEDYFNGVRLFRSYFTGNAFFKYYDSYDFVDFSDNEDVL